MSMFRIAVSTSLRSRRAIQVYARRSTSRNLRIFQDFSKKLKGEIDSNPELKKSIEELKEKTGSLKNRTKETAEHLYKQVDAARGEAETRAKQVSSVIKEKISEASEQVRETVASVQPKKEEEEAKKAEGDEIKKEERPSVASEQVQEPNKDEQTTSAKEEQSTSSAPKDEQSIPNQEQVGSDSKNRDGGRFSGKVGSVLETLRLQRVADVAKEGYNLLAEELTSTRRVKKKPVIRRSTATDIVPFKKNTTGWRKHVEDLKEKCTSHPVYQRFKGVKDPVVEKSQEIAEEIKDRWETSDSPVVHKIQDINDSLFGETATAAAKKEIRNRDPTFNLPDFVAEVQEEVRPIVEAYMKGDFVTLRKKCSKEVVERCRAEHRALRSQGMYIDNKLLYVSDIEVKESKLIGNEPIIIITFQTQQSYCVRDEVGHIREGSKDDIRTVYYAWAMQPVPEDERDPDDITPRWQLREMQQLGVQAII